MKKNFYTLKISKTFLNNSNNLEFKQNPIPDKYLNKIFLKSCEKMSELTDNSIHLIITSPPYNVGKEYDKDLSLEEYLNFLYNIWKECKRVLVPSGRICINIANIGRKPYIPLHSYIIQQMLDLGFLMRGEIIWNKGKSSSAYASFAFGTKYSAKNPILRDIHEYVLVFSKDSLTRIDFENKKNTIAKKEFFEFTRSVWNINAIRKNQTKHPASFPLELPYRLIQLYTFEKDIVLDPFMGSGQTAIAAIRSNRYFIGYEINEKYLEIALNRIRNENLLF